MNNDQYVSVEKPIALLDNAAQFAAVIMSNFSDDAKRGIAATILAGGAIVVSIRLAQAGELVRMSLVDQSGAIFDLGALDDGDTFSHKPH